MNDLEYPGLYQAANAAAISAQRTYLRTMKAYLWLLIIGAGLTQYSSHSTFLAVAATLAFLAALAAAIWQAYERHDRTWYNGRAVAESVKTRTWRYMMRAEPYEGPADSAEARDRFCKDLKQILVQNRNLGVHIGGEATTTDAISSYMGDVRALTVSERLSVFREERIDDQRAWYAKKYQANRRRGLTWLGVIVLMHAGAIIGLLLQVAWPNAGSLPISMLIVGAAATVTWINVKRFQDNATAYSLTAHEITLIREESGSVEGEAELSAFVQDAENAFSREHTQWVARRDGR